MVYVHTLLSAQMMINVAIDNREYFSGLIQFQFSSRDMSFIIQYSFHRDLLEFE